MTDTSAPPQNMDETLSLIEPSESIVNISNMNNIYLSIDYLINIITELENKIRYLEYRVISLEGQAQY